MATGKWEVNGTTATYKFSGVTLATVSGLASGLQPNSRGSINGIEVDDDGGKIYLDSKVLGNSNVSIKSDGYVLDFGDDVTAPEYTVTGITAASGTLKIKGTITKGYNLASDGKSIAYVAEKTSAVDLASVSGLNKNIVVNDDQIGVYETPGDTSSTFTELITVSGSEITLLDDDAIATTNPGKANEGKSDVKLSLSNGGSYELAIDTSNLTPVKVTSEELVISNDKKSAEIKVTKSEGYDLSTDKKTLKYTAEKTITAAKISGMVGAEEDTNIRFVQPTLTDNDETGVVTLTVADAALGTGAITLAVQKDATRDYKIELVGAAENKVGGDVNETGNYFVVSGGGTKAVYQNDYAQSWTVDEAGKKVTYTKAGKAILGTVSGLLKGSNVDGTYELVSGKYVLVKDSKGNDVGAGDQVPLIGIGIDDTDKVLTLDKRTLGAGKVTIGAKEEYTLAIDTTSDYAVDTSAGSDKNVWIVSGSSATLYNSGNAYYTLGNEKSKALESGEACKSILYTATDKNKKTALASLKGIAQNLFVGTGTDSDKLYSRDENGNFVLAAAITTAQSGDDSGVITLYKGAEATTNITVGNNEKYTLALSRNGDTAISAPTTTNDTWTYDKKAGKITLNAEVNSGFLEAVGGKTLTYVKPKKVDKDTGDLVAEEVVVISGLANPSKEASTSTLSPNTENTDPSAGDIALSQDEASGITTITLSQDLLKKGNVTINNAAYKLALDSTIPGANGSAPDQANLWVVKGANATFEKVVPEYWSYDSNKNTITYKAEQIVKTDGKDTIYATISGLQTKIGSDNVTYKLDNETDTSTVDNKTVLYSTDSGSTWKTAFSIDETNKKITFATTAVINKSVKLDTKKFPGYTLDLADKENEALELSGEASWKISGTTATLTGIMSDDSTGWTVSDGEIKSVSVKKNDKVVLATITGLAGGLIEGEVADSTQAVASSASTGDFTITNTFGPKDSTGKAPSEEVIDVNGSVITLKPKALNKQDVNISGNGGYTLALDGTVATPSSGYGWKSNSKTSANYYSGTTAGYTEASDTKITYSADNLSTYAGYISGIKEGFTINDAGELGTLDSDGNFVNGITVSGSTATISSALLGDSDVTSGFTLAIDGGNITPEQTKGWRILGSSALFTKYTPKQYTASGTKITYTQDQYANTVVELTGLKNGLTTQNGALGTVDKNGTFTEAEGITFDDTARTITLDDSVLDKKTVQVASGDYTLKLADNQDSERSTDTGEWKKKSDTAASYTITTSAGYKVAETSDASTNGKSISYKTKSTSTIDITGLKGVTDASEITETTFAGVTDTNKISGIAIDHEEGTITISNSVLNGSTADVKMSGNGSSNYELALNGNVTTPKPENAKLSYTAKDGSVVMTGNIGEGWTVSSDKKSILHTSAVGTASDAGTLATIKGLAKNVTDLTASTTDSTADVYFNASNQFVLSQDALGTSNVTITTPKGTSYDLKLADDVVKETKLDTSWHINGNTATYKTVNIGYYEDDDKKNSIIYHKETDVKNPVIKTATISGLDKDKLATCTVKTTTDSEGNELGTIIGKTVDGTWYDYLTIADGKVTVSKELLGTSNVTLKEKDYTLALASNVPTATANTADWQNVTEWVTSGNNATYKTYNKEYYTLNGNTITVTKATNGSTLATISGIAKNTDLIAKGIDLNDTTYYNPTTKTLTLTNDMLADKNVTLKGEGYSLAIDSASVDAPTTSNETWAQSGNKLTLSGNVTAGYTLSDDKKTVTYTKAQAYATDATGKVTSKAATLANISGIKAGLLTKDETASSIAGITIGEKDETTGITPITLDARVVDAKNITIGKTEPYKLVLDTTDATNPVPTVTELDKTWNFDKAKNGTLIYESPVSAGYAASTDGKTVTYTAAVTTALATISGLKKVNTDTSKGDYFELVAKDGDNTIIQIKTIKDSTATEPEYEYTDAIKLTPATGTSAGTIELLTTDVFGGNKISINNKDNYTLSVADALKPQSFGGAAVGQDSIGSAASDYKSARWYVSGSNAEIKQGYSEGYAATSDGKAVNYVKENATATVAKITGLGKGLVVSTSKDVVAVKDNNGNVTGFEAAEAGLLGTTSNATTQKNVKVFNSGAYIDNTSTVNYIRLGTNVLGTTDINLDSDNYEFIPQTDATNNVKESQKDDAQWFNKNGTVTLVQETTAGFTLSSDGKKYTYTKAGKAGGDTLVTVSGLNKDFFGSSANLPVSSEGGISLNVNTNVITLKNSALNQNKVTAKATDKNTTYTLALDSTSSDSVATSAVTATEWVTPINGTTATYKTYERGFYGFATVSGGGYDYSTVNYTKETNGTTWAKVDGLAKNATITGSEFDNSKKVVSVTEAMLGLTSTTDNDGNVSYSTNGKTVKVSTGDAYTLDISDVTTALNNANLMSSYEVKDSTKEGWTVSGGNANYKATITKGYMLSEDKKTLTWTDKDKAAQQIISISGLASTAAISDSDVSGNVITLDDNDLTNKDVKLSKGDGYTLGLSGVSASKVTSISSWNAKGGTGTLTGLMTAGWELSPDKKSVLYTAESKDNKGVDKPVNIAVIKGMATTYSGSEPSNSSYDSTTNTLTLGGADLQKKVTLSGGAKNVNIGYNFASDFSNDASITGTANSDSITIAGSGVYVDAGNGDDFVTFTGHGNTFFYASGKGNDVIANFASNDTLNINAAVSAENIKLSDDGEDVIVAIGKNSITLDDYGSSKGALSIIDKTKATTTYTWDSDLSCYVAPKSSSSSYVLEDTSSLSLTPTSLTKSDAVSYSSGNDNNKK